jgi:two-component system sensor histidine kinase KdpD
MADKEVSAAARLLVCVGPSPAGADVIRAARRMAASSKEAWFAVYVEDPKTLRLPEADRNRAVSNLRLAEQLGAETITLRGRRIAEEIVNFARQRQITTIVAGKPTSSRWKTIFLGSPVDELMRQSGGIDVYAITGEPAEQKESPVLVQPRLMRLPGYEMALIYLILATGLAFLMYPYFDLPNLIMVYLLGVMATAIHCGRGPAILNSLLSVLAFDFCFVPPRWTFTVEEAKYIVTFAVMFMTAVVISYFAALIRRQAEAACLQERQTAAMHALSRELAGTRGLENILQVSVKHFAEIFQCQVVALLPDGNGKLQVATGDLASVFHQDILKELGLVQGAYDAGQLGGWEAHPSPDMPFLYVPLQATKAVIGVLVMRLKDPESELWLLPEQLRRGLMESMAKQVAMALEVERLEKNALDADIVAKT